MSTAPDSKLSAEARNVLDRAKALPRHDQLRLAAALGEGAQDDEMSPAWRDEVIRRAEAYQLGELETVDGPGVLERIEAMYEG